VVADGVSATLSAMARETIRIEDLADPQLTPFQQQIVDATRDRDVVLAPDDVMEAARAATGLTDFGADDFRERLEVWLASANEDAGLRPGGRINIRSRAIALLTNRLRLEDLLKREPQILDEEIERPIIIVGLPRSGTTHLVNLIAADSRLRSLPRWEANEPIPVSGEKPGDDGVDPRLARCRQVCALEDQIVPLLRAMHHVGAEDIEEELEILDLDFASYTLEWISRAPRWRDYYLSLDLTPQYQYLKKGLQALQWLRGPRRWVLKSPQHLEQLGPLAAAFPDATVAITHRDPVSVIRSTITMLGYGARIGRHEVDLPGLAEYWIDRVERLLRAGVRDRHLIPAERSVDVLFHEFMADDVAMVEQIFAQAGLPTGEQSRAELSAFMEAHPRGRHGQVLYDLKADFGLDPADVRKRFDFYFDAFPVRAED
jgi:hypothetical protein